MGGISPILNIKNYLFVCGFFFVAVETNPILEAHYKPFQYFSGNHNNLKAGST